MPDTVITEALLRLEHKLDILINLLKANNWFLQMAQLGDQLNVCPVCNQQVSLKVDPIKKVVVRRCGCKSGLQAPVNLDAFAPPKAATEKRDERDGDPEQEDRRNSPGDRRGRRR